MKHYIISKFKEEYKKNLNSFLPDIKKIFNRALDLNGITNVEIFSNCIDRSNRFDLMIILTMTKDTLESYDKSDFHKEWKEKYGPMLENKAIFDSE